MRDLRILLIDDDPDQEFLIRDMIEIMGADGWKLWWASTWEEGWRELSGAAWDVCLLDHRLGNRTGVELLAKATENNIRVPIIMMTGSGSLDVDVRAMRAGAVDYVTKGGVTPASLERSVRYAVERARQRDALERQSHELEAKNRELEGYVRAISHDVRNPLSTILMMLDMLNEELPSDVLGEYGRYVEGARGTANRTLVLLDDLLRYATTDSRGALFEDVPLDELLSEVVADLGRAIEDSGADVSWVELPTVRGDRTLLRQLLENLVSNAVKYRRPDAALRIAVTASRSCDRWRVEIADNGQGIAEEARERVFAAFERATPEHRDHGTGLGLALAQKIVEAHGGQIGVAPAEEQGSVFWFTLERAGGSEPR